VQQTKTIQVGNCTVVIHRPELTPETRAKREAEVSRTLARYTNEQGRTTS
jgi:hypothetical protein